MPRATSRPVRRDRAPPLPLKPSDFLTNYLTNQRTGSRTHLLAHSRTALSQGAHDQTLALALTLALTLTLALALALSLSLSQTLTRRLGALLRAGSAAVCTLRRPHPL